VCWRGKQCVTECLCMYVSVSRSQSAIALLPTQPTLIKPMGENESESDG